MAQLPGHSPVAFSNSRAPCRSMIVLTAEKIAACTTAARSIRLNGYSVSKAFGGSDCLPGVASRQICLNTRPGDEPTDE